MINYVEVFSTIPRWLALCCLITYLRFAYCTLADYHPIWKRVMLKEQLICKHEIKTMETTYFCSLNGYLFRRFHNVRGVQEPQSYIYDIVCFLRMIYLILVRSCSLKTLDTHCLKKIISITEEKSSKFDYNETKPFRPFRSPNRPTISYGRR